MENPYKSPESNPIIGEHGPELWSPDAAGLWSLLLTPIFGSYILLQNWKAMESSEQVKKAKYWLVGSVIAAIAGLFIQGLALFYIITWYFLWQKPQAKHIKSTWSAGYTKKGWLVPVAIAFAIMAAVTVAIIGIITVFSK